MVRGRDIAAILAGAVGGGAEAIAKKQQTEQLGQQELLNRLSQLSIGQRIEESSPTGQARLDLIKAQTEAARRGPSAISDILGLLRLLGSREQVNVDVGGLPIEFDEKIKDINRRKIALSIQAQDPRISEQQANMLADRVAGAALNIESPTAGFSPEDVTPEALKEQLGGLNFPLSVPSIQTQGFNVPGVFSSDKKETKKEKKKLTFNPNTGELE